jgi:chromosome segregation ATPase
MANLKGVSVQELLDELLRRVEDEMTRLEANIEAHENEKSSVLHQLDEVLRRLASSTKEQARTDRYEGKRKNKETNH